MTKLSNVRVEDINAFEFKLDLAKKVKEVHDVNGVTALKMVNQWINSAEKSNALDDNEDVIAENKELDNTTVENAELLLNNLKNEIEKGNLKNVEYMLDSYGNCTSILLRKHELNSYEKEKILEQVKKLEDYKYTLERTSFRQAFSDGDYKATKSITLIVSNLTRLIRALIIDNK